MTTLHLRFVMSWWLAAVACDHDADPQAVTTQAPAETSPAVTTPAVTTPPEDPSHPLPRAPLYDLEVALTNHRGETIGLDVWRGHPTIIAMFYATCPVACPRLVDEISAFEAALTPAERADLRVLLVSFDAGRDTPSTLAEAAAKYRADLTRWHLATAPEAGARELAAVLGVKYRNLDDGQYFHTSVITLVDGDGRARARVEGLGRSADSVTAALRAIVTR